MILSELNYHHLAYFWAVARTGSVVAASEELLVSPPTVSAQVKTLERALGKRLFRRVGRGLELTETGRTALSYADEIFSLGRELVDTVRDRETGRPTRLRVGIADVVPKLMARRFLAPVFELEEPVHLVCREGRAEALEAELGSFSLDLVIAEAPLSPRVRVKAFSHELGRSGVSFYAEPERAERLREGFPGSLAGEPLLLPTEEYAIRRRLDEWFHGRELPMRIRGEFEDSALMQAFGEEGRGVFPVPDAIGEEVRERHRVARVGAVDGVEESYFAITPERKIRNPAASAITEAARSALGGRSVAGRRPRGRTGSSSSG